MGLFIAPWRVRRFFQENWFDVIHLHEPMVPSIAFWTAWLTPGVPKLTTFHAYGESPHWALRAAHKLFAAIQFPFIQRAVAVSDPAADYARIAWKRPIVIVPNGISTQQFPPVPETPSKELRLLFVGHLDGERKGFRYLLEAYGRLRERGVAVTLDVVGPRGSAQLPPPAPGLTYHGPVSLKALVHRYQSCDLFVAPSTGQESFGIVLLEAMSVAKPILCSDIAGYRHVVHAEGAVLVPPRDSGALAGAIEALARDPERRKRMAAVNREHVKQYDWDVLAPKLKHLYLQTIADCRGRVLPDAEPWAATQAEEPRAAAAAMTLVTRPKADEQHP
jgi:phosphatidylinositol alpha-mannosyltransferase